MRVKFCLGMCLLLAASLSPAAAIGLTVPQRLLAFADDVIR